MRTGITYGEAIAWIAKHEDQADGVSELQTVAMVADLFGVNDPIVAADVIRTREQGDRTRKTRTVADVRRARR